MYCNIVMLNRHAELVSGQHPFAIRGLRVKPAMTQCRRFMLDTTLE
jgi:hypothetical protein